MKVSEDEFRETDQWFCYKHGVIAYPVWSPTRRRWFIEVDATKRYPDIDKSKAIIRYPKEVGSREILQVKDWNEALVKTLEHWKKKIQDENRKEVYRPE